MDKMIAYCGLICTDCPAYIGTQTNDQVLLEKTLAQWQAEFNAPGMTLQDVMCDGCLVGGRKCGHCAECEMRSCGIERGVANCAHCQDYACEKLGQFFTFVPTAKITLDEIRLKL